VAKDDKTSKIGKLHLATSDIYFVSYSLDQFDNVVYTSVESNSGKVGGRKHTHIRVRGGFKVAHFVGYQNCMNGSLLIPVAYFHFMAYDALSRPILRQHASSTTSKFLFRNKFIF